MNLCSVIYAKYFLHMKYMSMGRFKIIRSFDWISKIADGALTDGFIYPLRHIGRSYFHKGAFEIAVICLDSSRFKDTCVTHSPQLCNPTSAPQHHPLSGN